MNPIHSAPWSPAPRVATASFRPPRFGSLRALMVAVLAMVWAPPLSAGDGCEFFVFFPKGGLEPFRAEGGTQSGQVFTREGEDCPWTSSTTVPWITITPASGTGSGPFSLSAEPNPGFEPRSGEITIAGHSFGVLQEGICGYQLSPSGVFLPSGAAVGTFQLLVSEPFCTWSATPDVPWITLGEGSEAGTGSATVTFSVEANSSSFSRSGRIDVFDGLFFDVSQQAVPCNFQLSAPSLDIGPEAGSSTVSLSAAASDCVWTASSNVPWIRIDPGSQSGSGSATISFSFDANSFVEPRTGTLTIAGRQCTVNQQAVGTTFVGTVTLDGSPFAGARVVSEYGGSVDSNAAGGFSLATGVPFGVSGVRVSAIAVVGESTYRGSVEVDPIVTGGTTEAGTIELAPVASCDSIDWYREFGGAPGIQSGVVSDMAIFDDGRGPALYVAGGFLRVGGLLVNNIARWDGQDWESLGSGLNNQVLALTVFDDGTGPALYAGGGFTSAGGESANGIARWDGTAWSTLGTGVASGGVYDLTVFDDGAGPALYAGGNFTSAGGVSARNVARWDGTGWAQVGTQLGTGGLVHALTVFNDGTGPALYAGGFGPFQGDLAFQNIARWDGTAWTPLGAGVSGGGVLALTAFDDGTGPALYAGGTFTSAGGVSAKRVARWNGSAWSPLGSGLDASVTALAAFDDGTGPALHVGGTFSSAGGLRRIARWNGTSWSPVGGGVQGVNVVSVEALLASGDDQGSRLLVGGAFFSAGPLEARGIAGWDGTSWSAFGRGLSNSVNAMAMFDDGTGPDLHVGGRFTAAGVSYASRVARWNGTSWSPLGEGVDIEVLALASFDDGTGPALYAGGRPGGFSSSVTSIFRWNGTSWSSIGSLVGTVEAMVALDDGTGPALYVGGNFTAIGGVSASRIARWDGQAWRSLGSGLNGTVNSLAAFDDGTGLVLYAGGNFTAAGGVPANRIARWSGTAWHPLGLGLNSDVETLMAFDDGQGPALYAGGSFTIAGDVSARRIARWDGAAWSHVGSGTNGVARTLAVFDDGGGLALYAAGAFNEAGGIPVDRIARWDGESWLPLRAGFGFSVFSIQVLSAFDDGSGPALAVGTNLIEGSTGDGFLFRWGCPPVADCTFSVAAGSTAFPASGGSGTLTVTASAEACEWTSSSGASWVGISPDGGVGSGTATLVVSANPLSAPRTGSITVAGVTIRISQAGTPCEISLSNSAITVPAGPAFLSMGVSTNRPDCRWTVASDAPWLVPTVSGGIGSGLISFTVSGNQSLLPRVGTLAVGGTTCTVTQAGVPCNFAFDPPAITVASEAGTGSASLSAAVADCAWTASSDAPWLTVSEGSGVGSGNATISFSYTANETGSPRTGRITAGGIALTITQERRRVFQVLMTSPLRGQIVFTGGTLQLAADVVDAIPPTTVEWSLVSDGEPPLPLGSGLALDVPVPAGTPAGRTYLIRAEGVDSSGQSDSDERTIRARAVPDLAATAAPFVPEAATSLEPIPLGWQVINAGHFEATGTWVDRIYWSTDGTIGPDDILAGSVSRTGPLLVGTGYESAITVPAPAHPGRYRAILSVDHGGAVDEGPGESDNTLVSGGEIEVTYPPSPDLTVAILAFPTEGTVGTAASVTWQVTNAGEVPTSGPWLDRIYLSIDDVLDTSDVAASGLPGSPLAVGASYTRTTQILLPQDPGFRRIIVVADEGGQVFEAAGENNNAAVAASPTQILPLPRADLVVSAIATPSAARPGDPVEVQWTVFNAGQVAAASPWVERVFVSSDGAIGSDLGVLDVTSNDPLEPGASAVRTRTIATPNFATGYRLVVCVDQLAAVTESDDANNCAIAAATTDVIHPDLVLDAVSAPAEGVADSLVTVTWTGRNAGDTRAAGTWVDTVCFSTDATVGNDLVLGSRFRTDPLEPGAAYDASVAVRLPGTASGNAFLYVTTDAMDSILEEPVDNNIRFIATPIAISQPPRPNLVVATVDTPSSGLVGTPLGVTWSISNQGPVAVLGSWVDRVWAVPATGPRILLGSVPASGPLAAGASLTRSLATFHPTAPGTYLIEVETDAAGTVNEGVDGGETDNLGRSAGSFTAGGYAVTASTPFTEGPGPVNVVISGQARLESEGTPVPDVAVVVAVRVQGTVRHLTARTDAGGLYSVTFSTLPGEAGRYEISAASGLSQLSSPQDEFIVHALRAEPRFPFQIVYPGLEEAHGAITLRNPGDVPLGGLVANLGSMPAGLSIELDSLPPVLEGGGIRSVGYRVRAVGQIFGDFQVPLTIATAEGAEASVTFTVRVQPPEATLVAAPTQLVRTMILPKEAEQVVQTLVEFTVRNVGAGVASAARVNLPAVPWMRTLSPVEIGDIPPGESRSVLLSLTPPSDLPLGPYAGSLVIVAGSAFVQVPYSFQAVSTARGSLIVETTDEFTYFAEGAPMVSGALVTVADAFTGRVVAEGTTQEAGTLTFEDLPESWYRVRAVAPEHGTFAATVFLGGNEDVVVDAFLPARVVTYSWTVVPTTVQDEYRINLDLQFETNVPAPVITAEPGFIELADLLESNTAQFDLTVTNHGLITAEEVEVVTDVHPLYRFTPLITEIGDLPGNSSIVVPVIVERIETPLVDSDPCTIVEMETRYSVVCGRKRLYKVPVTVRIPDCPPPPLGGGGVGGGGVSGGGFSPPPFGGPPPDPQSNTPPEIRREVPCDRCCEVQLEVADRCTEDWEYDGLALSALEFWLKAQTGGLVEFDLDLKGKLCYDRVCCDCQMVTKTSGSATSSIEAEPTFTRFNPKFEQEFEVIVAGIPGIDGPATVTFEVKAELEAGLVVTANGEVRAEIRGGCDGVCTTVEATVGLGGSLGLSSTGEATASVPVIGQIGTVRYTATARLVTGGTVSATYRAGGGCTQTGFEYSGCFKGVYLEVELSGILQAAGQNFALQAIPCFKKFLIPLKGTCPIEDENGDGIEDCPALPPGSGGGGSQGVDDSQLFLAFVEALEIETESKADFFRPEYGYPEEPPVAGNCAAVAVALSQDLVISRSAFEARLELGNDSGGDPMQDITVEIEIQDAAGNDVSSLFALGPPVLTGLSSVDGDGSLASGSSGTAIWTLIPTDAAALTGPRTYWVSGLLSFRLGNETSTVPLFPAGFTVLPNPSLHLKYFIERDVYGDDPFTERVEPSVPFTLGLLLENRGFGEALGVRLSSAQPRIVENTDGLLVNFDLLGTRVGTETLPPTLNVELGAVSPGATRIVEWSLASSLQGEFTDYSATLEGRNALNQPGLALIDSVSIHEILRAVRVMQPSDDLLSDFLANDEPDSENLPDRLHLSDGTVEPVTSHLDGTVAVDVLPLRFTVTVDLEAGWNYVRVDDFFRNRFRVASVVRPDGSTVAVGTNAWQTSRIFRPFGGGEIPQFRFHLLDRRAEAGPMTYTVFYVPDVEPPSASGWRTVSEHAGLGEVSLPIAPSGFSEPRAGGIGILEVVLSESADPATVSPASVLLDGLRGPLGTPVDLSGIAVSTSLLDDGRRLRIGFNPSLPDHARFCVRLVGVKDFAGNPLIAGNRIVVDGLVGDASGDRRVNNTDVGGVLLLVGTALIDPSNALEVRSDVDRDGDIDQDDVGIILAERGNELRFVPPPCPVGSMGGSSADSVVIGRGARPRHGTGIIVEVDPAGGEAMSADTGDGEAETPGTGEEEETDPPMHHTGLLREVQPQATMRAIRLDDRRDVAAELRTAFEAIPLAWKEPWAWPEGGWIVLDIREAGEAAAPLVDEICAALDLVTAPIFRADDGETLFLPDGGLLAGVTAGAALDFPRVGLEEMPLAGIPGLASLAIQSPSGGDDVLATSILVATAPGVRWCEPDATFATDPDAPDDRPRRSGRLSGLVRAIVAGAVDDSWIEPYARCSRAVQEAWESREDRQPATTSVDP